MIEEIKLSSQLLANLTDVDGTITFIGEVVLVYLAGVSTPLKDGSIDGKKFKRRLDSMLEAAIAQKNPNFNHRIETNIDWGLKHLGGFSCRILVGISDFSLSEFGPQVSQAAPLWQ